MVEEVTFEYEVDHEVHVSPVAHWRKSPRVHEVLQRPSFDGVNLHLSRSIECDFTSKTFPEWAEPDLKVSNDFMLILTANARATTPRYEGRIFLHVRHDQKKLVCRIGKCLLFLMTWHIASFLVQASSYSLANVI